MTFEDQVLDFGLDVLHVESEAIYLCEVEPTSYALATSGLGYESFGEGSVFNAPSAADDGNGRRDPVADSTFVSTGTVQWWAVVGVNALHA